MEPFDEEKSHLHDQMAMARFALQKVTYGLMHLAGEPCSPYIPQFDPHDIKLLGSCPKGRYSVCIHQCSDAVACRVVLVGDEAPMPLLALLKLMDRAS